MMASGEMRAAHLGGKSIVEAVIDLVGDNDDAGVFGGADQVAERGRSHHRTAWIGGRSDDDTLERRFPVPGEQGFSVHRPARRRVGFDAHRLAAERGEDMAIGRIARQRHANRSPASKAARNARMKPAEEPVVTTMRCWIDVDIVPFGISASDAPAQRENAERFGVAERAGRQAPPAPPRLLLPARLRLVGRLPCE